MCQPEEEEGCHVIHLPPLVGWFLGTTSRLMKSKDPWKSRGWCYRCAAFFLLLFSFVFFTSYVFIPKLYSYSFYSLFPLCSLVRPTEVDGYVVTNASQRLSHWPPGNTTTSLQHPQVQQIIGLAVRISAYFLASVRNCVSFKCNWLHYKMLKTIALYLLLTIARPTLAANTEVCIYFIIIGHKLRTRILNQLIDYHINTCKPDLMESNHIFVKVYSTCALHFSLLHLFLWDECGHSWSFLFSFTFLVISCYCFGIFVGQCGGI